MLSFDQLYEFRVLGVVNVGAEGDIVHRHLPWDLGSFQGRDFVWFVHDFLREQGHEFVHDHAKCRERSNSKARRHRGLGETNVHYTGTLQTMQTPYTQYTPRETGCNSPSQASHRLSNRL